MDKIASAHVKACWVNPSTGDSTPIGQFSSGGVKAFSTPDGWEDAMLILEAADGPAPAEAR